MPSLVKLYEEYKNDGFVVLAINIREKRAVVEKYARKLAMPFPILLDKGGEVAFAYSANATPAHYLINRKGEAAAMIQGGRDWTTNEHRNLIRYILEEK